MNPVRKQRLILVLFIVAVASAGVALIMSSLSTNLNLFFTPKEIFTGLAPSDARIRAGGMVVRGSVERDSDSMFVRFKITDGEAQLEANYTGILPDLFAEGEAAVVAGRMDNNGVFQADEVLAKHDENYTPPEVAEAMEGAMEEAHEKHRPKKPQPSLKELEQVYE